MKTLYYITESKFRRGLLLYVLTPAFLLTMGFVLPNAFADQVEATIHVGTYPNGVAVNPSTNEIYVASDGSDNLSVINGSTDALITTISLGDAPTGVAVNPATDMVYVAANKQNLHVINGSTNTVSKTMTLSCQCDSGQVVQGVSVNSNTNTIYVTMKSTEHLGATQTDNEGSVVVVDGATNTQVSEVANLSGWPSGVAVNNDTNMVYATTIQANIPGYAQNHYVFVVDGSTNSNVTRISVPNTPTAVATNPQTNRVYVTEETGGTLAVIDGSGNTLVDSIAVGSSPDGVGVNPLTNTIYVANHDNNTVSVIDGSSNNVSGSVSVGVGPGAIAVNPDTGLVYVANKGDGTISVIKESPKANSQSVMRVSSEDSHGDQLPGFYTELYAENGTQLDAGYTPYNFTLVNGQNYTVHVENYGSYKFNHWADTRSTNSSRTMSISNDAQITAVYATIPTHPSNLTATAASSSEIDLTWNVPSSDGGSPVTGYRIQESTDDSTWTTIIKNTGNTNTAYDDTGLSPNTTYYYRVFALNSVGSSYRSNIASATTPILSVGGVSIGTSSLPLP